MRLFFDRLPLVLSALPFVLVSQCIRYSTNNVNTPHQPAGQPTCTAAGPGSGSPAHYGHARLCPQSFFARLLCYAVLSTGFGLLVHGSGFGLLLCVIAVNFAISRLCAGHWLCPTSDVDLQCGSGGRTLDSSRIRRAELTGEAADVPDALCFCC